MGIISDRYIQGTFNPLHPEKCVNNNKPRFLSSYELKFLRWCDKNPNVIKWGSENVAIPYVNPLDGKVHKYLVDNFILFKNKDGSTTKYLVEIKPSKQTKPPVTSNRKKKHTVIYEQVMWACNTAKWTAARAFCEKMGFKFLILTEAELGIKSTK